MKVENGVQKQEGLCLTCAKELGIKPVNDIMSKMGITEDELENMEKMFTEMLPTLSGEEGDDGEDSPTIDFSKLMRSTGMGAEQDKKSEKEKSKNLIPVGRKAGVVKPVYIFRNARGRYPELLAAEPVKLLISLDKLVVNSSTHVVSAFPCISRTC